MLIIARHKKTGRPYLKNEKSCRRFACVKTTWFLGHFRFPKNKKMYFWVSRFLDISLFRFLVFWIFSFLAISGERKELPDLHWCQNDRIQFKNKKKWGGFLVISWGTKRATRCLLLSKRPDFWGVFRIPKKWISGYLFFLGTSCRILGTKRATGAEHQRTS